MGGGKVRESSIEAAVVKYGKSIGCLVYKLTGRNDPDRLFVAPDGHAFFIEFKAPRQLPRPGQRHEHKRITDLGHPVYVVDDTEKGKDVVHKECYE